MEARQNKNKTNVVFGICNKNFTQFRKLRYFDCKVRTGQKGQILYLSCVDIHYLTIIIKKGVICLERDVDIQKEPDSEETQQYRLNYIGQTINAIFCSRNSKPRCVRWTSRSFLNTKYKTVG